MKYSIPASLVGLLIIGTTLCQEPARVAWTMDLAKAKIPEEPVSGKVHGKAFKVVFAHIPKDGKVVRLGQGKQFPEETIDINFWQQISSAGALEGKKFEFSPAKRADEAPGVILSSVQPGQDLPKMQIVIPGEYALKMEFAKKKDDVIPGRIYFATKDKATYVAGTFDLKVE